MKTRNGRASTGRGSWTRPDPRPRLRTDHSPLASARPDLVVMLVKIAAVHEPGAMDGISEAKNDDGREHHQAQPIFASPHDGSPSKKGPRPARRQPPPRIALPARLSLSP